jgi:hypothetical protein
LTRGDTQHLYPYKPLSFVYSKYPTYTPDNTLIIDDNVVTFSQNIENAIGIKPFFYDLIPLDVRNNIIQHDYELLKLIDILNRKLNGEYVPFNIILDPRFTKEYVLDLANQYEQSNPPLPPFTPITRKPTILNLSELIQLSSELDSEDIYL